MKIKPFLNGNLSQTIAIVACTVLLLWVYSCQPQTTSLLSPSQRVTRAELALELETFIAKAEIGFQDLQKQEELRQKLFEHAALWAQSGTVNPLGVVLSLAGILGLGATTDNVRKRIKNNKSPPV